jgi:cyclophilin family peptidyl-prolyl cis-trans isomerase
MLRHQQAVVSQYSKGNEVDDENVKKVHQQQLGTSKRYGYLRTAIEALLIIALIMVYQKYTESVIVAKQISIVNDDLSKELGELRVLAQENKVDHDEPSDIVEDDSTNDKLKQGMSDLARKLEEVEGRQEQTQTTLKETTDKLVALESAAKQRNKAIDRLKKALTETSLDQCEKKFPKGPAHVLMKTNEGDIEIEMAPCHLMPVVTMYFIKQVEEGFWDGMVFFRAESHVIQATDMKKDGSRNRKTSRSIPFQEYSDQFVHHKYTLGIAGRPGGPDFYINMSENIRIHGPGGQVSILSIIFFP